MVKGSKETNQGLAKCATGIAGFDEITLGGLPSGRPTLIIGGPGSGKTLFALEFLVNGAMKFDEPGVFISFEETETDLEKNVSSLGFDLKVLKQKKMLCIDQVQIDSNEIIETGSYDLEGLFVRLGYAIDSIGAKRIVLDTIEAIFSSFSDTSILRSEIHRIFRFLKEKGVTAIVTGEKGELSLSRYGLEEYVSDAVILLDNRVIGNIATRRMRIVKYRGSSHGTNEYPFLIDEEGFSILPITSLGLLSKASKNRISTGIKDLDDMFGGAGYFEGSSILLTGQAGSGKTSFGAELISSACKDGKKGLLILYEESIGQIVRNMSSIGIDLQKFIDDGRLLIHVNRPDAFGLEMHLLGIHKLIKDFEPDVVVIDPVSSLMTTGEELEVRSTMIRTIDLLKGKGITSMFTDLKGAENPNRSSLISSLADTWILLEDIEANGENNRLLRVVKSRGMAHSNQIREFMITSNGIKLMPLYVGPHGVMTGSARYAQEAIEHQEASTLEEQIERAERRLEHLRTSLNAQVESLQLEFKENETEITKQISEDKKRIESWKKREEHLRTMRSEAGKRGGDARGNKRRRKK
jgi:circadian clock protein KaiC